MTSGTDRPAADDPAGADQPGGALPAAARAAAERLFGERLPHAERYATLLATDGVVRGLIGPREAPRLWDRHLLNCAVVQELIPARATVADVGSGAGLPGVVLALARPDLTVTLIEAMARRAAFLDEVVTTLDLTGQVTVVRARAEESVAQVRPAEVVTARALAPLDRLAQWCLPLTTVGGHVLAIKGASAEAEIAHHAAAVRRLGGSAPTIHQCGVGLVDPPTTVVAVVRESTSQHASRSRSRSGSGGGSGSRDGSASRRGSGSAGGPASRGGSGARQGTGRRDRRG